MQRLRFVSPGFLGRVLTLAILGSVLAFLPGSSVTAFATPAPGATGHIDEFPVTAGASPVAITKGPDGNLWFTESTGGAIGRISVSGTVSEFPVTNTTSGPTGIVAGPNGNLFFTELNANAVGEMSTAGAMVNTFGLPTATTQPAGLTNGPPAAPNTLWAAQFNGVPPGAIAMVTSPTGTATAEPSSTGTVIGSPTAITAGPDGNLWFTSQSDVTPTVGRLTPAGVLTNFPVTTTALSNSNLGGITTGPDGNLWFTEAGNGTGNAFLDKVVPGTGVVTRYSLTATAQPLAITAGPDGDLWVTDAGTNSIDQFTVSGTMVNSYALPSANAFAPGSFSSVGGITVGPDGNLWFTEQTTNKIGRLTIQPSVAVSPNPVAFGDQAVGVTSSALSVSVTASGGGSATITAVSLANVTGTAFAVASNGCTNAVLTPTSPTCTLGLTFTPLASGAQGATLTVTSTASNSPQVVPVTGNGLVVSTSVFPPVTLFPNTGLGTTSTSRPVFLGNAGPGNLKVSNVFVTGTAKGEFPIVQDHCSGQTLAPQAICTVGVEFAPVTEGVQAATISFVDNAGNSPQSALLIGRGVQQSGYWLVASDGGIFSYGPGAKFFGSTGNIKLNKPVVGMAATPDSQGYWLVATDGGIFSYGDANFFGSTGSIKLNQPVVGMASTPDGQGYWLVASDGGIFSYGDAKFFGSTGSIKLNKPIVGMASTADGQGYWLVASDGGIFAFGDAGFFGSAGSIKLNKPVVGMAPTADGQGYWLDASDGGIFTYGDATFQGSAGSIKLNKPMVGMTPTPTGGGYWLDASDGGIFSYGDAKFFGSAGSITLNKPMVGMAASN